MKIKVKDHEGLIRDTNSMAILNVNKSALAKDMMYKERNRRDKQIDDSINKLNNDVSDIKELLGKILENLGNRGP